MAINDQLQSIILEAIYDEERDAPEAAAHAAQQIIEAVINAVPPVYRANVKLALR